MARRQSNAQLQKQFARKLKKVSDQLPREGVRDLQRKVGFEALKRLIEKTPVDTGRARGGWHVTINYPSSWKPPKNQFERPDGKGRKGRNTRGQFTGGIVRDADGPTLNAGIAVLKRIPGYSVTYVTNNVEYIERLDKGHSKQAPKGMLNLTLQELLHAFRYIK